MRISNRNRHNRYPDRLCHLERPPFKSSELAVFTTSSLWKRAEVNAVFQPRNPLLVSLELRSTGGTVEDDVVGDFQSFVKDGNFEKLLFGDYFIVSPSYGHGKKGDVHPGAMVGDIHGGNANVLFRVIIFLKYSQMTVI
mmetsp:Transcript_20348/g.46169  ORF Transcript_20348/g.46169 Transcript_20348/m.46169 type:complete len:139 (-) Transcript_20348:842-1258(-)